MPYELLWSSDESQLVVLYMTKTMWSQGALVFVESQQFHTLPVVAKIVFDKLLARRLIHIFIKWQNGQEMKL